MFLRFPPTWAPVNLEKRVIGILLITYIGRMIDQLYLEVWVYTQSRVCGAQGLTNVSGMTTTYSCIFKCGCLEYTRETVRD